MSITLECGGASVAIEPSIGGSILRYVWRDREVLRSAPAYADGPLQMGFFPLVPFANRIARGAFDWHRRSVALRPNFGDHPHPLHGHGWQNAWRVAGQGRAHALLAFDYAAGDWPWSYGAKLGFSLGERGLRIVLSLTNRSDDGMPASLGFHPYFRRSRQTRLTTAVAGMWQTDKTQIPTTRAAPILDFAKGAALGGAPLIDHCFTAWDRKALIDQPDDGLRVALGASRDARFLHLFVPQEGDYFCAEPVTAMPDAINRREDASETGLRALAPGATCTVSMTIMPKHADL